MLFQFSETLPEQGLTVLDLNGRDWHRGAVLLSQSHAGHGVLAVYQEDGVSRQQNTGGDRDFIEERCRTCRLAESTRRSNSVKKLAPRMSN